MHNLIFSLSQDALQIFFAFDVFLLVYVEVDFPEEATPYLILNFYAVVLIHPFQVLAEPSLCEHSV